MGEVLKAASKGDLPLVIKLFTFYCVARKIEDPRVCDGVVKSFGAELVAAAQAGQPLEAAWACYGLGVCPRPDTHEWNVTESFPKAKPVYQPPSYSSSGVYRVLHLSDLHVDRLYQVGAAVDCGEPLCCRADSPVKGDARARKWGEYNCDIPDTTLSFVLETVAAQVASNGAQMLLWTGDTPPHFLWEQNQTRVLNDTGRITGVLAKLMSGVQTVVPSIGNHESYPVNNFGPPALQSWLYTQLASDWGRWLPPSAAASLAAAGYFSVRRPALVQGGKPLKIISVQTNYCNNLAFFLYVNDTDPGNQLHWLIDELQDSEDRGEAVFIIGHIAPVSEDCRPVWSGNVVAILNRYENIMAGQFYGHTHRDQFSINWEEGRASTVQYIAPSVTTFHSINPSWRYYVVDKATHQVVDTETWHVDLTKAYAAGELSAELFYSARSAYNMTSLFAADWLGVAKRMASDNATFALYHRFLNTGTDPKPCDDKCRESELCSVLSSTSGAYKKCTKQPQVSNC